MRAWLRLLALVPLIAFAEPPGAGSGKFAPPADGADPRVALAARLDGVRADDLRPSPIPGLYELTRGAEVAYVSADGRYMIGGDVYEISKKGDYPNLTDQRRRELRAKLVAEVPDSQVIVFAPAKPQYTITVFTDPDCVYCRKMHSQIAEYNKLGIKVRYAFFPREGPNTEAWTKSEQVWCSKDRQDALTRAKKGEAVTAAACKQNPVQHTWEVGRSIGLEGTPGVILADGEMIPGYLPPQALLAKLKAAAGSGKG